MKKPSPNGRKTQDGVHVLTLVIDHDLIYLDGHFPEHPIVPGFVLLAWAEEYAREFLTLPAYSIGYDNLKFQHIVEPGNTIQLHLRFDELKDKLYFWYFNDEHRYASGTVIFESP